MRKAWTQLWQGTWIGVAIVLPGISGGTAALIMGIYRDFVEALSGFRWAGMVPLLSGIALGVLAGARAVGWALEAFPTLLAAFLLGLVLASTRAVAAGVGPWGRRQFAGLMMGFSLSWIFTAGPGAGTWRTGAADLPRLFAGGLMASGVMIFPGLSGGTLLIVMGLYEDILWAINNFELVNLLVFLSGGLLGITGFSRLVACFLRHQYGFTMATLLGLMLGSLRSLWPAVVGFPEILAFAAGALLILAAGKGGS